MDALQILAFKWKKKCRGLLKQNYLLKKNIKINDKWATKKS